MNVPTEKLLSVDDAFFLEGRGVIVTPQISLTQLRDGEAQMFFLLRTPEGIESRVLAQFSMPHVPHPKDRGYLCLLQGLKKDDVPVGSEIRRFIRPNKDA